MAVATPKKMIRPNTMIHCLVERVMKTNVIRATGQ
jgi:hypothetical protein